MQFAAYLKRCRRHLSLTQEELVTELYLYDDREFTGLEVSTLSKWERGRSQPSPFRLAAILRFFQDRTGLPLPCMDEEPDSLATIVSRPGIDIRIGKSRVLYLQLPLDTLPAAGYRIISLNNFDRREQILELHQTLYDIVNSGYGRVDPEQFRQWSLDTRHFFQLLLYKDMFLGLLFALRMKPVSFGEIIRFKRPKNRIVSEDFADLHAPSSLYILSSFALHPRFLSTLYMKLTVHLITYQRSLRQVGLITSLPEAKRMAERLHLHHLETREEEGETFHAFAGTLGEIFRGEELIRAIFPRSKP